MVFQRLSQARGGQHLLARLGVLGLFGLTLILAAFACPQARAAAGDRTESDQRHHQENQPILAHYDSFGHPVYVQIILVKTSD